MRALARRRAEKRHKKTIEKILIGQYANDRGIDLAGPPDVPAVKRPNLSGGSHDTDWPCPYCRHVNSIKRRSCAKCGKTPANGRRTRAAQRELEAEHRTREILKKHGL